MYQRLNSILTKKQKLFFLVLLVFGLLSSLLEIIGLSLLYPVISIIISNKDNYFKFQEFFLIKLILIQDPKTKIFWLCCFISILYLIKNTLLGIIYFFQTHYALNLDRALSLRLFKQYTKKPIIFFLNSSSSIIIRNCTALVSAFSQQLMPAIQSLFIESIILIGIVIFLMTVNFKLTLLAIIFFGILILLINLYTKKRNYNHAFQIKKLFSEKIKIILETFGIIKDIKFSGNEEKFYLEFDKISKKMSYHQLRAGLFSSYPRLVIEYFLILTIVLCIYYFSLKDLNIQSNLGILAVFLGACLRLYPSINKINQSIQRIVFSQPALEEIESELLKILNFKSINLKNIEFSNCIELRNVSYGFSSNKLVLSNINFKISKYDKVGICGTSGSGKTTFINLLSGMLTCSNGNLVIDNIILNASDLESWSRNIGYVSQNIHILDDNLINNITLKNNDLIDQDHLNKIISDVKLDNILPNQRLGENGSNISGGQKQRIGIARALYLRPKLLILDEATNSLDKDIEKEILINLQKMHITILAVSHDIKVLSNFKTIYEINNNTISELKIKNYN
jgi:ABC-type multidrug transport system fused ATPase/permease subunit